MAEQQSAAQSAPTESNCRRGVRLFQEGRFEDAALALADSLREQETSEVWNDWAAAELAAGQNKAERGFRRALALDAGNTEAAANLGALLAIAGRHAEAIPFLEKGLKAIDGPPRPALQQFLDSCRTKSPDRDRLARWREERLKKLAALSASPPRAPFDGSPHSVGVLKQEMSAIHWYHRIDLGHGLITPGCRDSSEDLRMLHLPARLDGLTVLDIGAWDGFFSFEAERRGALRVLATDGFVWKGRCPRASRQGFELARWALNSKVEGVDLDIMDISPDKIGTFDLVLLDALYPLRHPIAALERALSLTNRLLILRTHLDLCSVQQPAMAFYPHDELAAGASDWWSPNRSAVTEILRSVGFEKVTLVEEHRANVAGPADAGRGKAVFHAEK